MKVQVDSTKCDAYGLCGEQFPELFELDDFGYAMARNDGVVQEGREAEAGAAVGICPALAIRIVEQ
ncbi:MAG: Ferredoxin [Blastococcus sp.]|nr:Ferredoxin [Blastococcus sp.]